MYATSVFLSRDLSIIRAIRRWISGISIAFGYLKCLYYDEWMIWSLQGDKNKPKIWINDFRVVNWIPCYSEQCLSYQLKLFCSFTIHLSCYVPIFLFSNSSTLLCPFILVCYSVLMSSHHQVNSWSNLHLYIWVNKT